MYSCTVLFCIYGLLFLFCPLFALHCYLSIRLFYSRKCANKLIVIVIVVDVRDSESKTFDL